MTRAPRAIACVAFAALSACQVVEPTILQRQGRPGPAPEEVFASLAEEHPAQLPGPAPRRVVDDIAPLQYMRPKIGDDERLQVEFRDAALSQVIHFLADRAGINIYLDPGADTRVDLSFKEITLDAAMHAVLDRNGRRLVESPPGVFWIERNDGSQLSVATFTAHSISADAVTENLKALVAPTTTVIVEPTQNLIVVRGAQSDIDLVKDYLARADHSQRQVLIEVRILEVVLGDNFQFGVTHDVAGTVNGHLFGLMQNLGAVDNSFAFQFNSQDGDVDAAITAIRRVTGTDLVSSPRILALTGVEASIEVVKEIPYVNVTSTTTANSSGQGVNVVEEVQFKEAGVKLKVTPVVQDDGAVRIVIDQELSEVVDTFNQIPVLDKRFLKSSFVVQDRATVVLGGLMQDKRTQVDRGVPGLMDIPWLGRLFRNDNDQSEKRELIVFLTPRIVDSAEVATMTNVFKREYSERIRETGVSSHVRSDKP